jgi:hypothetical protein
MIHELSWAQIILIEIGAMFQLVAVCAVVRNSSTYRQTGRYLEETETTPEPQPKQELQDPAVPLPVQHPIRKPSHPNSIAGMRAADLLKTARVTFKQSLKGAAARDQFHPSGGW